MLWKQHNHWLYAWIPLFGAFIWFAMLWAMLITWLAKGRPHYPSQTGKVVYISDVGASFLKPLFITGCSITSVSLVLTLMLDQWLRHRGRLLPMRPREKVSSTFAILGAVIGGAGLILLSVFDTRRHHQLHRVFLLVFIVGVVISAIFTILEFGWLSHDFRSVHRLKITYVVKGLIAAILIVLAIVFAATMSSAVDVGGIMEWIIAFGFTFYLLSFVWDIRMAKGVRDGELKSGLPMHEPGPSGAGMRESTPGGHVGMNGYV